MNQDPVPGTDPAQPQRARGRAGPRGHLRPVPPPLPPDQRRVVRQPARRLQQQAGQVGCRDHALFPPAPGLPCRPALRKRLPERALPGHSRPQAPVTGATQGSNAR